MSLSSNPGENSAVDIQRLSLELDREVKLLFLSRTEQQWNFEMNKIAQLVADACVAARGDDLAQATVGITVENVIPRTPRAAGFKVEEAIWKAVAMNLANR